MRSSEGEDILREHDGIVYFATNNKGKYIEAADLATVFGLRLKRLKLNKVEIQSDDLGAIASFAAKHAAETTTHAVVTEDAGFFVDALGGFPGPYSSYVFKAIGYEGILKLLHGLSNRNASFRAAVAFCEPKTRPLCFRGIVRGTVNRRPKGTQGFGFDPIFVPTLGDGRTFAEMNPKEKNVFSHRARAFAKFFTWLIMDGRRIPAEKV
jgi:XTP/dITP diphosphohydrolase